MFGSRDWCKLYARDIRRFYWIKDSLLFLPDKCTSLIRLFYVLRFLNFFIWIGVRWRAPNSNLPSCTLFSLKRFPSPIVFRFVYSKVFSARRRTTLLPFDWHEFEPLCILIDMQSRGKLLRASEFILLLLESSALFESSLLPLASSLLYHPRTHQQDGKRQENRSHVSIFVRFHHILLFDVLPPLQSFCGKKLHITHMKRA